MALGAVLLAWTMYWLDGQIPNERFETSQFVLSGTVGELRTALLGVASTTLATAGVVFTLLTLPLGTVVAQFGSRLLRLFLGDRTTQLVLGMFVLTFVYAMAAALSIEPVEVQPDAPQLTATVGLYLMLATFSSLILLVQHISTMLQAPNIAAAAGAELVEVILAERPTDPVADEARSEAEMRALAAQEGHVVQVLATGYIHSIDPDYVLTLLQDNELTIHLLRKPGDFVQEGEVVATIWPSDRVDSQLNRDIQRAFRIGNQRTPTQDAECAVNQLVEMAVRAMSPAINDPFTAMTCLDHMGTGLSLFARHGERSPYYHGPNGQLRLILAPVTLEQLLDAAFTMLRHASSDNVMILLHMLATIEEIGCAAKSPGVRRLLQQHIDLIMAESQSGALVEQDQHRVHTRGQALRSKLEAAA
jgi:uncharacterized membrane protein